jgi:FMN phosphatase YigB (HAD superfamily)
MALSKKRRLFIVFSWYGWKWNSARSFTILQFLKDNNQPIALGSASKNARPILEKTGFLSYFDAVVDGNDVTNAKPDPKFS